MVGCESESAHNLAEYGEYQRTSRRWLSRASSVRRKRIAWISMCNPVENDRKHEFRYQLGFPDF